jgi:hypothetical protein
MSICVQEMKPFRERLREWPSCCCRRGDTVCSGPLLVEREQRNAIQVVIVGDQCTHRRHRRHRRQRTIGSGVETSDALSPIWNEIQPAYACRQPLQES